MNRLAEECVLAAKTLLAGVSLETDDEQTKFVSEEMAALLNQQVANEMYAAYLYFMVAAWSETKGLTGFAKHFKTQGNDEIAHAMKVYGYLVATNTDVTLPAIPSPESLAKFSEMQEATRAVADQEMKVTADWKQIGELAKGEPNLATQELAQWFMTEQVEEENKSIALHQKVQLADTGSGILLLDAELAK